MQTMRRWTALALFLPTLGCDPGLTGEGEEATAVSRGTAALGNQGDTGYQIEVHTCDINDAGTNSLITASVHGTTTGGGAKSLGGWDQDWETPLWHTKPKNYDDHERGNWDVYFEGESTPMETITELRLQTDGKHNKPGWCWDEIFITRIEHGVAQRTWRWAGQSPWIGEGGKAGTFKFPLAASDFAGNAPVRSIRYDRIADGVSMSRPNFGKVLPRYVEDIDARFNCEDKTFALSTGASKPVMGMKGVGSSPGYARCEYATSFEQVTPGTVQVTLSTPSLGVIRCGTVKVHANTPGDLIDLTYAYSCN